ncbi:glycine betaine ABC transporter substrate-binding protein [Oerskovia sp. M15]
MVLEDDKHLQTVDNIIPAANAAAVADQPAVLELLDTVSAALDTDKLIALNKAVDVDRQTSAQVAQKFVEDESLAATDTPGRGRPWSWVPRTSPRAPRSPRSTRQSCARAGTTSRSRPSTPGRRTSRRSSPVS